MNEKRPKKRYIDSLDSATRQRYDQKIACIGVDPYETKGLSHDPKDFPAITYIDIINYLVNTKSAYTMNELKAFKSLDSYNQFVNGWVRDVVSMTVNSKVLVTGKVRHSQRMNDTALKPWLISTPDGIVESAHCDCMAGLGESCSHVGALLFYVDSANRITANQTVTQQKAYWLLPTSIDKIPYSEVSDIDFTSADMKKKRMDSAICGQDTQKKSSSKLPDVAEPTAEEISELNNRLFACNAKASALSVRAAHQESYIPDILKEDQLPVTFVSLKEDKYVDMERIELVKHCESVCENMSVTEDQARNAEILTRQQSKCKEWHSLRTGRITASNMKSVCVTSTDNPAISTVNSICGRSKFTNKATKWGCDHEAVALAAYTSKVSVEHENAKVNRCGLFISTKYPHIGASPDALVSCDCCGEGVVEIKCPYCMRDTVLSKNGKCGDYLLDGVLRQEHKYSYQIQTQMLVTGKDFCDFVVWTEKDLLVERIEPNFDMREKIVSKSTDFFIKVILPEMTGNLITREKMAKQNIVPNDISVRHSQSSKGVLSDSTGNTCDNVKSSKNELICICQKVYNEEDDDVIGCDNENCPYVWLHFTCIKIKKAPKGSYYCPECKPMFKL